MAVLTHAYQGYEGYISSRLHRPLVIFRYALKELFESRRFSVFFVLCLIPSVVVMVMIYMRYNLEMLIQFDLRLDELMNIDADFFALWMQRPQMGVSFLLIMIIGPSLVSPDLRNNALSLYLSRSISKSGYIFGKLLVLLVLSSLVTWVPALMLVLFQAYLADSGWLMENLNLLLAPIVVSMIWIFSLSIVSLAISAWVRWKVISRLFFFGIFFLGSALGSFVREVFGGWVGGTVKISRLAEVLTAGFYDIRDFSDMPLAVAVSVFVVMTIFAAVLLSGRIRAFEVVS